jgi:hypothetical protein
VLEQVEGVAEQEVRRAQRRLLTALANIGEDDAGRPVVVFAEGAIRGSLAEGGEDTGAGGSGAGTGSFGASVQTRHGQWTAKIVIASTDQAVLDGYGSTVLSPGTGKSLASGLLDLRTHVGRVPLHVYSSVASSRWGFLSEQGDTAFVNTTVLGAGALYYHEIANGRVGDNSFGLSTELGLAVRFLDGNARNSEARREGFGEGTVFGGLEGGFGLAFGGVLGTVQAYYLFPSARSKHVDGLTGLNLVAGLGVTAEFLRGRLRF